MDAKNMWDDKIINVTRPSMPQFDEYIEAIKPLWESHWLTNMGVYHAELEEQLKDYLNVSGLSLMVNGHMALELAIQMMEFPEGGEVITTPFTFVSTTHAIVRNRLHPVFCDVKLEDGTIDESKIESLITEKTVAIVAVHVYGNVCNVEGIQKIADKHGLKVIYDAAHAFGVKYKGKGIGGYGDASIFSFHATKVFNTIEGGAVAFKDYRYYKKLHDLKNFGIRGEELVVDIGANAKMNEFCAVMGLCNLKHIETVLAERKRICNCYRESLKNIKGIIFFKNKENVEYNYAYFPLIVEKSYGKNRDKLYDDLKKEHIYARKYFYPLTSDQVCYKNQYLSGDIVNARRLAERVITLPLFEGLDECSINKICNVIKES